MKKILVAMMLVGSTIVCVGQIVGPIISGGGGSISATNTPTFGQNLINDGAGHSYWGAASVNSTNAQVAQYSLYSGQPTNTTITNSITGPILGPLSSHAANIAPIGKKISVMEFIGAVSSPPMLTATNINGHGWADVGDGITTAITYCQTNSLGINTLYFPPGIYRIAARTKIVVPPGISLEGVGFLHGGVQNTYDQVTTNYSELWFDNLNAVGVVFIGLSKDVSKLSYLEINGYTNPVAHGVEMAKAPLANFALVGLSCVDTNQGWNGWFRSHMVSVAGFHVGIDNRSAQCDFDYTMFGYNYVGFTCLGTDPATYLRNTLTNNPSFTNLWALGLANIPAYGGIYPLADSAQVRHSGGGLRDDGTVYFISGPRNMSINNDSGGACYRYIVYDGNGGALSVNNTYFEIFNSYSGYTPTSTNPIACFNGGKLIFNNVSIGMTQVPQNTWGEQMTNFVWIDNGIAAANAGGSEVVLNQTLLNLATNLPSFYLSAGQIPKLITMYFGFRSHFVNNGNPGWIYHSSPGNRNLDYYSLAPTGYDLNEAEQINDEYQHTPAVTTNLANRITSSSYGKIIHQLSNPDYFSVLVRSNSMGDMIVGGFPQQTPLDTNSMYWERFLLSDPGTPVFYPSKETYEPAEKYSMDQLTARSNVVLTYLKSQGTIGTDASGNIVAGSGGGGSAYYGPNFTNLTLWDTGSGIVLGTNVDGSQLKWKDGTLTSVGGNGISSGTNLWLYSSLVVTNPMGAGGDNVVIGSNGTVTATQTITAKNLVGNGAGVTNLYGTNVLGRSYHVTNVTANVSVPDASKQYQDIVLTTGTNVTGFANLITGIKAAFSVCYSNSTGSTIVVTNAPTSFPIGGVTTNQVNLLAGKQCYWSFDIIPGVRTNYCNAQ